MYLFIWFSCIYTYIYIYLFFFLSYSIVFVHLVFLYFFACFVFIFFLLLSVFIIYLVLMLFLYLYVFIACIFFFSRFGLNDNLPDVHDCLDNNATMQNILREGFLFLSKSNFFICFLTDVVRFTQQEI